MTPWTERYALIRQAVLLGLGVVGISYWLVQWQTTHVMPQLWVLGAFMALCGVHDVIIRRSQNGSSKQSESEPPSSGTE